MEISKQKNLQTSSLDDDEDDTTVTGEAVRVKLTKVRFDVTNGFYTYLVIIFIKN